MGAAFRALPADLQDAARATSCKHSVQRYFKIRPSDVYRPVAEVLADIEKETPTVVHPSVVVHPVTGEEILYMSEGFALGLVDEHGSDLDGRLLQRLLDETGQLDETFSAPSIHLQTYDQGDMLVWDNRSLIHRALHTTKPEPTASFRVTVHDEHPFYVGLAQ
jgi:taurine dioxygenase